ncbi:hypothetical protein BDN67DRAFT_1070734 [Paxillus ammoniavirescens]|nr:hypothetical protein BDN67DRAFT_1070734 [Paxillus ammoniavirescens]
MTQPMFEREAMWISFDSLGTSPAVKVSVGGNVPTPPNCKQDYVVAGLQPWLDGIMTASGVVRQFVGMSHGSGYTVEEQVTGKAEHGGLQFDIFPVRDMEFTVLDNKTDVFLEKTKTPAELSLVAGDELRLTFLQNLQPRHGLPSFVTHDRRDELSSYLSKAVGSIVFEASYFPRPSRATLFGDGRMSASSANWEPHLSPVVWTDSTAHVALGIRLSSQGLGLAGGGNIAQRIYEDTNHVRVYDEESGQRLFVHVVTPKEWELITGIIAPIIPISASTYKQPNVPWFQLSDDHTLALSGDANSPLSAIKSVAQLDAEKPAEPSDEIDPDHPPSCSNHSKIQSVCVFRPCSHTACSACLGAIMMLQMKCLTCEHKVERVVGMKDAIVVPTPVGDVDGLEWDVSQMEELASLAADSKNVSIIHLEEDRVPPLHASNPTAFHR